MLPIDEQLQRVFRLSEFRPHQREIIEDVIAGHDVVCVMPTGAGKSLCYQLPAVVLGGLTIVVSPLIALMADQVRQLRELGVPSRLLNSSQDSARQRETLRELDAGFTGILYVAPERFAAPSFRALLPQLRPRLFVVDEAHCVSFWGHDFRPDYMRLAEVHEALGSPVTAALTATATPQVRNDIVSSLKLRSPKMHVTGFDRPNLRYAARYFRNDGDKDAALLRGLAASPGTGIVYCATRKTVEELAAYLKQELPGRTVCGYHAGMTQPDRKASQERFMNDAGRDHRRHQRLRHGNQQARHSLRAALQPAGQRGSLLPGGGPSRTRRPYCQLRALPFAARFRDSAVLHREDRRQQ